MKASVIMYIDIENLSKEINHTFVLKNISIHLESGKIYGFKGKNGSGKTMLMRAVSGLIIPSSGTVNIDGDILGKDNSFPKSIGALIESPGFISSYSGFKNLKLLSEIRGIITDEDIKKTMISVGLDPSDNKKFKKYSLGMKQKLGIAAAVMEDPDIVILDEPINALDEESVEMVKKLSLKLKKEGKLIIISCHDKEELEFLSDIIFEICEGEIVNTYEVGDKNEDKE